MNNDTPVSPGDRLAAVVRLSNEREVLAHRLAQARRARPPSGAGAQAAAAAELADLERQAARMSAELEALVRSDA